MKPVQERVVTFSERDVDEWCTENSDPNPIHTDPEMAEQSSFGQRIVPGMMLLDKLSGMLTNLGEDDEEIILSGVTAARFRDPVLLGETVHFTLSEVEDGQNFTTVDFEARVHDRDSLVANGALSIVVR
jgi:acyl dehydratase